MVAAALLANLLCIALFVVELVLLARVVLSWLVFAGMRPPATGPLRTAHDLLFDVTEPLLGPLRKIVPPAGMFDLSVLVAFVIIYVLRTAFC